MDSIRIQGGIALQGKVRVQGSKNAALPILAATLVAGESSFIRDCPRISDVYAMLSLLKGLGCTVVWQERGVLVDSTSVRRGEMRSEAVTGMRSSLCLLGALLARCGEAVMEHPGGCVIGERPIDLHLMALGQMGAEFTEENGLLRAEAKHLHGAEITLPKQSVGATENVILAAVAAEGDTVLSGAAREPEVVALCRYLQHCGADIDGVGSERLVIRGGNALYGTEFCVPADRIVAGTYLLGCVGIGGNAFLEGAPGEELMAVLELAEKMGARCCVTGEGIYVQAPEKVLSPGLVVTAPYPAFPTDLQSVALAVSTVAEQETVIEETVFENRFRVVGELERLGASIGLVGETRALVHPVSRLTGAEVVAKELRGGAALVVAGLMAQGVTTVKGCGYIYRGYENICRDFRELGARVISV